MRILLAGMLAAAALAIVALRMGEGRFETVDPQTTGGISPTVERFRVLVAGTDVSCVLIRDISQRGGVAPLRFDADCQNRAPVVAAASHWREEDDGSVVLTGGDGRTVLHLAAADGADWESFAPGEPLISLLALK